MTALNDNSDLRRILQLHADKPFVLVEPGGNNGDKLIYFGMKRLADSVGIKYRSITAEQFLSGETNENEIIYLHGGGGFNQWCSGRASEILGCALSKKCPLVIQGPCTLVEESEYLEKLGDYLGENKKTSLVLFCREKTSFQLCLDHLPDKGIQFYLDRDTAFWADRESLEQMAGAKTNKKYRLYAIRQDNESSAVPIFDKGKGVELDPAYFCRNFVHWIRIHLYASEIITSRTHSAIIGAQLQKPVTLYPGRYHKNHSIWQYSLRDAGVKWGPDECGIEFTGECSPLEKLPGWLRKSYKVNRLFRWFQKVPLK